VLVPFEGDAEVVVRSLTTGTEWRYGVGSQQPPPDDEEEGGPPANASAPSPVFTADARFVIFPVRPTQAEVDQAKKDKKKPEDQPKNALAIMDLSNGSVTRVERVKTFQVPRDGSNVVVYLKEAAPAPATTGTDAKKKTLGTDLVLHTLPSHIERTFAEVIDYTASRDARTVLFVKSAATDDQDGLYVVSPGSAAEPAVLLAGKGKYTRLTWDDRQTQLAFLSDRDDSTAKQPRVKLYRWARNSTTATEIASAASAGLTNGWTISDKGALDFSIDGAKLFFGVAPAPPDPGEPLPEDDQVHVDLWNWRDDFIQPMQKVRATQDRNRSYRAAYDVATGAARQLADETMPGLTPSAQGRWAFGMDDRAYRRLVGVDATYADVYLVNTADGSRKPLTQQQQGGLSWSPDGTHALFYRDRQWFSVSVPDGTVKNLTSTLGTNFFVEDVDTPVTSPPSYGNAGWTRDGRYVLLYDRYDVWQIAADGTSAKNLTDGLGRRDKLILRVVPLERPEPGELSGIDPAKPLLLHAENETTHDEGFYRDRIDGGAPERLLMDAKSFSNPAKARNADTLLFTESTYSEFPDLLVSGMAFADIRKVSDANPQRAGLLWGSAELMHFRNTDGVPLSGILMKPDNFDPGRKYPMVVYIYEKLSQNLHAFVNPTPTNSIRASYYTSNGYLVLMPDIVYTIGYPGESALNCVLPAVQAVVDKGFVDENAIGIQGHSWGGYQIAYMTTRTNRFKAAAPGAVVANMTSAYSGIRWGTGLPRQFQYEHTQSRIGGTIWEYPMRFLENSPRFGRDRVQPPIRTIHNDADDAVPWYQGIEYYLGLRRLGKEVYLFSYNGEPHNLRRNANRKDYTRRLQEFFDHFLKGAPEPDWMRSGIPYLQKERINAATTP